MKIFVAILAIVAFVAGASAASVPTAGSYDGPIYEMAPIEEPAASENSNSLEIHPRDRRLTCDFFSFSSKWFTPNNSACAMKCIGMRRRGGTCQNGMCVCRNDRW